MEFPLPGWPLFRLGFRPFYLGAAAFAALAVPYWVAALLGVAALPATMPPLLWHAHEMLFGFAVAVIVGFLLTAGKAWTGLSTPRGATLAVMATIWLAARLAALGAPYAMYALLDTLLLPWVAGVLLRVLWKSGNRRNLPLGAVVVLLASSNLAFHAAALGWLSIDPLRALYAGLALIVMIECVIAGRVIPAFTMSALPGLKLQTPPWLERAALATTALSLAAWVLLPVNPITAAGFSLAALLHTSRLWHWQPWRTKARPILWV
ncbi:MAG TPA: NnrS family protein, partial [Burkholderiaceae bacterium]|nr:NnrS family protein [Burkholderiaceae bacterium]